MDQDGPAGAAVADTAVPFTRAGALRGARRTLPLALAGVVDGVVFGVLAGEAGLGLGEAALMSGLVYAGGAQFVVVELWTTPLPVATILLTTLVVNARHLLMGAALRPWLGRLAPAKLYPSLFFMSDESWALTLREWSGGRRDGAFLLGSGVVLFVAWVGATITGRAAGGALDDPARWGLDFAFTAVFVALLVGMWHGRAALAPWATAALVALAASRWLPGAWYIPLGGLAGSLVGAMRDGD